MKESIIPNTDSFGEYYNISNDMFVVGGVAPFFSMRKVRLVYNELVNTSEFEFATFDAFKNQVLGSVAPQLELNKWQAIAARR